jgi:hypothetical protein
MSRSSLASLLCFLALAGFIIWQTLGLAQATCEVCVEYRGLSQCRTVSAATPEEAQQGAVVNACAYVSSGVTDSMACQRATPVSSRCW